MNKELVAEILADLTGVVEVLQPLDEGLWPSHGCDDARHISRRKEAVQPCAAFVGPAKESA
jgi:hypothetical protein